jgi:hypothetical protein
MNNNQDPQAHAESQQNKPFFVFCVHVVEELPRVFVKENGSRLLERNSVLAAVQPGFDRIPFKS